MKNKLVCSFVMACLLFAAPVRAQQAELEQLILNIQKLIQLRAILDNMYQGYKILTDGYNTIKDLSEGNFDIHKHFLDGLLEVSPTVRQYKKVKDIVVVQQQLLKECRPSYPEFRSRPIFNYQELGYFKMVYQNVVSRSLANLDELLMVMTAGRTRMNDAERLSVIDRIYDNMVTKLQFVKHFRNKNALVAAQRAKKIKENDDLRLIYGFEK